MVYKRTKSL